PSLAGSQNRSRSSRRLSSRNTGSIPSNGPGPTEESCGGGMPGYQPRRCGATFSLIEHCIATGVANVQHAPGRRRREAGERLVEIGSTIRRLRRERGLSLRDLGRSTGFSISFLSLVERGRSSISLTSLHTLAVALGVEMSEFFPKPQPELAASA